MVPYFDRLAPFLKIDLMVVHQEVGTPLERNARP
jgi:hypothetical protein